MFLVPFIDDKTPFPRPTSLTNQTNAKGNRAAALRMYIMSGHIPELADIGVTYLEVSRGFLHSTLNHSKLGTAVISKRLQNFSLNGLYKFLPSLPSTTLADRSLGRTDLGTAGEAFLNGKLPDSQASTLLPRLLIPVSRRHLLSLAARAY